MINGEIGDVPPPSRCNNRTWQPAIALLVVVGDFTAISALVNRVRTTSTAGTEVFEKGPSIAHFSGCLCAPEVMSV
jgi:hypothetical protein